MRRRNHSREDRYYERLAAGMRAEHARNADKQPAELPNSNDRADYTMALRELADWLDANPDAPLPMTNVFYAPASNATTLAAVASGAGMDTATDDETKTMSAFWAPGPVLYEAFAYLPGHPALVVEPGTEPF